MFGRGLAGSGYLRLAINALSVKKEVGWERLGDTCSTGLG